LARELIDANCDLIFAIGPEYAPRALKSAGTSIPVVFFANDYDPLQASVVDNLARPGGNITGVYVLEPELVGKRLQLIREALPTARRVLVFSDPFSKDQLASVHKVAQAAGLEVSLQEFANPPYDLVSALERAPSVDALMVMTSPVLFAQAATLRAPLAKRRLPSIAAGPYVDRGILFGFGPIIDQLLRRTAEMGVAILNGASAGAIPVEQAREFEFIVNAGVAREIGLRIPQALLARATRIVQ
jgi:putative ABC transport system substrate-binding protein